MTELFTGTSGFAYKEWKGSFYPEDLKNDGMLGYYASQLPAVEINNTFYRMPKREVLERWAEVVPPGFRFVLKASRRITHQQRLEDCEDTLRYLIETSAALGAHRGPFLFQLPPYSKKNVERLRTFLTLLPDGVEAAFEFRNETWHDDETYTVLRDAGGVLCVAHGGKVDTPLVSTGDWGYLRLRGESYGDGELADWAAAVRQQGWKRVYAFFKHEDAGAGPRLAARFAEIFEQGA
jgi:uncharacterized protein YecE (DUF72 family)